jgi:chitinase
MPFDNGGPHTRMVRHAVAAASQLHALLHRLYPGASSAALYAREGLSEMNGRSDNRELTTVSDFRTLATYAVRHRLGRLTYWAVNRDRPCPGRKGSPTCSGTAEPAWAFTRALAAAQ